MNMTTGFHFLVFSDTFSGFSRDPPDLFSESECLNSETFLELKVDECFQSQAAEVDSRRPLCGRASRVWHGDRRRFATALARLHGRAVEQTCGARSSA